MARKVRTLFPAVVSSERSSATLHTSAGRAPSGHEWRAAAPGHFEGTWIASASKQQKRFLELGLR